jgi:hypothetical protein
MNRIPPDWDAIGLAALLCCIGDSHKDLSGSALE